MSTTDAREAIEQLRLYFAPLATRQGILARKALGQPAPDDEALAHRLIDRMRAETRADGSVAGGVIATVWRAHELLDLGCGAEQSDWGRVMGWVLERQGKPGSFSEGCTPARHSYRACEHFISASFRRRHQPTGLLRSCCRTGRSTGPSPPPGSPSAVWLCGPRFEVA